MSKSLKIIQSLLPEGFLIDTQSDLYKITEVVAEVSDEDSVIADIASEILNPQTTPYLDELEHEAGLVPNSVLTELQRRQRLDAHQKRKNKAGWLETMQAQLDAAGFGVTVYDNYPAVDPTPFAADTPLICCADPLNIVPANPAVCGAQFAQCSIRGGYVIVNGDEFIRQGDNTRERRQFALPADSGYWPLIFFIGGAVVRDIDNSILDIEIVDIHHTRRQEFISIVTKAKPMHSLAVLAVVF